MGDNDPIISWEKKSSGDAASDMEEGENAVKVSSTKAHVFVVEKRQRVYSEPYLDVAYNEDSLDEATYNFCEVDYTRADRVIKRFRKDYSEVKSIGHTIFFSSSTMLYRVRNSKFRVRVRVMSVAEKGVWIFNLADIVLLRMLSYTL